jgi:hypothetical protein
MVAPAFFVLPTSPFGLEKNHLVGRCAVRHERICCLVSTERGRSVSLVPLRRKKAREVKACSAYARRVGQGHIGRTVVWEALLIAVVVMSAVGLDDAGAGDFRGSTDQTSRGAGVAGGPSECLAYKARLWAPAQPAWRQAIRRHCLQRTVRGQQGAVEARVRERRRQTERRPQARKG